MWVHAFISFILTEGDEFSLNTVTDVMNAWAFIGIRWRWGGHLFGLHKTMCSEKFRKDCREM